MRLNAEQIRKACPAFFYRPNTPASEAFILLNGGMPGSRSQGDAPFFETDAKGRISAGGNRAGKSAKLVLEIGSHAIGMRPWYNPYDPNPMVAVWATRGIRTDRPTRTRYVVPNFSTHLPEVFKELRKWWPKDWWKVISTNEQRQPTAIEWFTGAQTMFMSQKQNPEDFEGVESDLNAWDEPPKKTLWVRLNRGLVSTGGRWIVGATMLDRSGWFWDEVINPADNDDLKDVVVTWHSIWDNCAENGGNKEQTAESIRFWLEGITDPDERMAREHGSPIHLGGLVLKGWKDDLNLVEPWKLPEDVHIVSCIDPAGARPFAGLHIAYFMGDDGWEGHVFDETYLEQTRRDLSSFATVWHDKEDGHTDPRHPKQSDIQLIDPAAQEGQKADRGSMGRTLRQILQEDYDIATVTANRQGKRARLLQLDARVRQRRYKVWTNCRILQNERRQWSWDPTSPKQTRGKDDLCDCWSYIDGIDPPSSILHSTENEFTGGVYVPEWYQEATEKAEAARRRGTAKIVDEWREQQRRRGSFDRPEGRF